LTAVQSEMAVDRGASPGVPDGVASSGGGAVVNALTVDVEDWVQSVLDPDLPLTDGFYDNTMRVLELFAAHGVRGTFFVLGLAAERSPRLVREIQSGGHDVQSHGYGHRLIHTVARDEFRADVERSKKLLEDLKGTAVTGYRAPAFSIVRETLWALDVLAECGYTFDSSIVPARTRRYGIEGARWYPHRLRTPGGQELMEWPVMTYRTMGRRRPIGGGGYFRLYPAALLRRAVRQLNDGGHPATIYMHPYEFNPGELARLPHAAPLWLRLHQGLGRGGFRGKVEALLRAFRFAPIGEAQAVRSRVGGG